MSVAASPSDRDAAAGSALQGVRAVAGIDMRFRREGPATRLADLGERGGFRVKFPRPEHGTEAVTINTGGGMLGGDCYRFDVTALEGAHVAIASQSAERVYRTLGASTDVQVSLTAAPRATLLWVPQETILFNGGRLQRQISADVAGDATLLLVEAMIFGRQAMGENVKSGQLVDHWRIRRAGRLVYADAVRIGGDVHENLQRRAAGDGARAAASIVYIAPDAEERLPAARDALGTPRGRAAVSAWNGMLIARFLASTHADLRPDIIRLTEHLMRRPMPRVWGI